MIIDMKSSGETFINPVSYVQKINGQETSISRQKFMFDAKHFNKFVELVEAEENISRLDIVRQYKCETKIIKATVAFLHKN